MFFPKINLEFYLRATTNYSNAAHRMRCRRDDLRRQYSGDGSFEAARETRPGASLFYEVTARKLMASESLLRAFSSMKP